MGPGFLVPLVCFACIAGYGFNWKRLFARDMEPESASPSTHAL
jgi:hypothetical protein